MLVDNVNADTVANNLSQTGGALVVLDGAHIYAIRRYKPCEYLKLEIAALMKQYISSAFTLFVFNDVKEWAQVMAESEWYF